MYKDTETYFIDDLGKVNFFLENPLHFATKILDIDS